MILCVNNFNLFCIAESKGDDSLENTESNAEVKNDPIIDNLDNIICYSNKTNVNTFEMDSRIGLDYIVENSDYVSKLAAALDTNNSLVKKQVFELLSALCAYSPDGYSRAIETLENYKVSFWERTLHTFTYKSMDCNKFYSRSLSESQERKISL